MTVTYPIVTLGDGEVADAAWFADITEAVNSHESRLAVVESYNARVIRKTADQTVNNTTTLTNDTGLVASVEASTTYVWETNLFISSNSTADIKIGFTWPALATASWMAIGYLDTSITFQIQMTATAYQGASGSSQGYGGGGDYPTVQAKGLIRVGATAGNLQMQFAQLNATAVNTTIKQDSWLKIEKVLG